MGSGHNLSHLLPSCFLKDLQAHGNILRAIIYGWKEVGVKVYDPCPLIYFHLTYEFYSISKNRLCITGVYRVIKNINIYRQKKCIKNVIGITLI